MLKIHHVLPRDLLVILKSILTGLIPRKEKDLNFVQSAELSDVIQYFRKIRG